MSCTLTTDHRYKGAQGYHKRIKIWVQKKDESFTRAEKTYTALAQKSYVNQPPTVLLCFFAETSPHLFSWEQFLRASVHFSRRCRSQTA